MITDAVDPDPADDRVRAFAAFDHRLREAAAREGFVLVPPTG